MTKQLARRSLRLPCGQRVQRRLPSTPSRTPPAHAPGRTCDALLQRPLRPLRLLLGHAVPDGSRHARLGLGLGANLRQPFRLKLLARLLVERGGAWRSKQGSKGQGGAGGCEGWGINQQHVE